MAAPHLIVLLPSLGRHAGHLAALCRAVLARLGATLAVGHRLVLLAFGLARFADLGADPAEVVRELGAAAHETRCSPANSRAVAVQADASRQPLHFLFV